MTNVVTIIARDLPAELRDFVKGLGYSVLYYATPRFPPCHGILVWFVDSSLDECTQRGAIVESLHVWLGDDRHARAVVVSQHAVQIRDRVNDPRVWVLAAPLYEPQLADVLRELRSEPS